MDLSTTRCGTCTFWDPSGGRGTGEARQGRCRRNAPSVGALRGATAEQPAAAEWPVTLEMDWCGEWKPGEWKPGPPPAIDDEEDRQLRNMSMAQALMTLSDEKRDRILDEVLTDEELERPEPPHDFYERVQDYLARQRDGLT